MPMRISFNIMPRIDGRNIGRHRNGAIDGACRVIFGGRRLAITAA